MRVSKFNISNLITIECIKKKKATKGKQLQQIDNNNNNNQ